MNQTISKCEFCGQPSTLLCDGRVWTLQNGKRVRMPMGTPAPASAKDASCDAHVCRSCAKKVADIHIHARNGCRWDTRDLCPNCQRAQEKPVEMEERGV